MEKKKKGTAHAHSSASEGLTAGALLFGGSGSGGLDDLRLTTAAMAEISRLNRVWMVLWWTSVRCGGSLACRHVRMYCRQEEGGATLELLYRISHLLFWYLAAICSFSLTFV